MAEFKKVAQNQQLYAHEVYGSKRTAKMRDIVYPIDTHYIRESGLYELRTPIEQIHKGKPT